MGELMHHELKILLQGAFASRISRKVSQDVPEVTGSDGFSTWDVGLNLTNPYGGAPNIGQRQIYAKSRLAERSRP